MKRIIALLVCLLLLAAQGAQAIVDLGHPAVTRIWTSDAFACSATYIREARPGVAWILSAGHCAIARYTKRNATVSILGGIDWRVTVQSHAYSESVYDIAIGTVPDVRPEGDRKYYSFFAEKFPEEGVVYIHGFPLGIESVVIGTVVGPAQANGKDMPGTWEVRVRRAGDVMPGSSGSVVLDGNGYIVGVLWGLKVVSPLTEEPTDRVFVTDIAVFHSLAKIVGLKL